LPELFKFPLTHPILVKWVKIKAAAAEAPRRIIIIHAA